MNPSNQLPEVFTRKEAATLLRICLASFDKLRLPSIRVGRRVLYLKKTLVAFLSANEQLKEADS